MKEKLLKKSKRQRNWGIGFIIISVLGFLGGFDESSDISDLILGCTLFLSIGIILLIFSKSNKNKSNIMGSIVESLKDINETNEHTDDEQVDDEQVDVKENPTPVVNVTQSKSQGRIIEFICAAGISIILLFIILPMLFKNILPASDNSILEAAENEAKSLVSQAAAEIPSLKSEVLDEGDDWTLVKVSYKIESSGFGGTFIFHVYEIGSEARVHYEYKESAIYDLDVSEEEIEVIKAQWKLE